jgi:two-component system sensor histidine kinase BarA
LRAWDFGVAELALTAEQALEKTLEKKYDAIYLDLSLPDLDGKVVAKRIRENAQSPNQHTQIIGLMEYPDELNQEACVAYGFNRVLAKPLTEQALREKIEEVVVDWDLWRKRCGGHEDLVQQAFDITMRMLKEFKAQSMSAIKSKDYEELDNVVHKCYGGLKYCSLPQLEKTTFVLQNAIRAKQYDEVAKLHPKFIEQIDAVLELTYCPK